MASAARPDRLGALFEAAVRRFDGPSPLAAQVHHHLGFGDDGTPPPLTYARAVVVVAEACGADAESVADVAAAVEVLHQSLCVHDDVAAETADRGGRATIWRRDGPAHAINAGDALSAIADLQLLAEPRRPPELAMRLCRILKEACLRRCAGERGALWEAACVLGARAAGADDATVEAFARLGRTFGGTLPNSADVSSNATTQAAAERLQALLHDAQPALR